MRHDGVARPQHCSPTDRRMAFDGSRCLVEVIHAAHIRCAPFHRSTPCCGLVLLALTVLASVSVCLARDAGRRVQRLWRAPPGGHVHRRRARPRPRLAASAPAVSRSRRPTRHRGADGESSVQRPSVAAVARTRPASPAHGPTARTGVPTTATGRSTSSVRPEGRRGLRRRGGHACTWAPSLPAARRASQGHRGRHLGLGGPWWRRGPKYNRLDAVVAVTSGRLVTPADAHQAGMRPQWRHRFPAPPTTCTSRCVRVGSPVHASTRAPCSMCSTGQRIRMPDARGVSSWNNARLPKRQVNTPAATSTCISDTWSVTPAAPGDERPLRPQVGHRVMERAADGSEQGGGAPGAVEPEPAPLRLADVPSSFV